MKRNTITIIELVIVISVIVVVVSIKSYKIPESKPNYVSKMTVLIKEQINIVDDYVVLTDKITSGEIPAEEAIYNLQKIKASLIENKRAIKNITPPMVYVNVHRVFIKALQCCIDSVEIFLSALNIKDEKVKEAKVQEAKSKLKEYKNDMNNLRQPVCPDLK
jgi:hypothetical protein